MHQVIISLGSNLGNRLELLQKSLILLENEPIAIKLLSSLYETPAWGFESTPFFNACALIETPLKPNELIAIFLGIEEQLGRFRDSTEGYTARPIDLDLLFYEEEIHQSARLTIPHPRLHLRNFVLLPLVEIAPHWKHPVLKKSTVELLSETPDTDQLEQLPFLKWSPPIFDAFPNIAIEGNIGVGKTTLAQKIASEYKLPLLQEAFAKNPYLEKFYADPKTYGLAVEQFFLLDRIKQGQEFWKKNKGKAVSDYTLQKSLIFARQNLNDTNFKAYKTRFEEAYPSQKLPDLMVYLYTDMNTLQAQIKKRGRSFEQGIKKEYLEQIELGYQKLIAKDLPYPVVSINTKGLDFESNRDHYQSLLRLIYRVSF